MAITMKATASKVKKILGIGQSTANHSERLISALGGFLAIFCIIFISQSVLGLKESSIIIASMGATAVLLFAVPHSPLSQPWSVFGGHVISALIGVTFVQYSGTSILSASLAVGIAIGAMYYLRCLHPPGGATALAAVLGGESIQALSYQFVLTPILINIIVILLIAFLFNYLFTWRRYPAYLQNLTLNSGLINEDEDEDEDKNKNKFNHSHEPINQEPISKEDFIYALQKTKSFIDVNEEDLIHIYKLATANASNRRMPCNQLKLGQYYSNGEYGEKWSVRQIVDESQHPDTNQHQIIYKVITGPKRRSSACISLNDFSRWAKYQVELDEENWKRVK